MIMAQHYGMTPAQSREIDDPRDLRIMMEAAAARFKSEWQRTLWIVQAIQNHGGRPLKRPQSLGYLYDQMFGKPKSIEPMDGGKLSTLLSSISKK